MRRADGDVDVVGGVGRHGRDDLAVAGVVDVEALPSLGFDPAAADIGFLFEQAVVFDLPFVRI
jgi:hypothetical protein